MQEQHFYELVEQMRAAQKTYFKERTGSSLVAAKKLEKQVDAAIASYRQAAPAIGAVQLSFTTIEEENNHEQSR